MLTKRLLVFRARANIAKPASYWLNSNTYEIICQYISPFKASEKVLEKVVEKVTEILKFKQGLGFDYR